MRPTITTALTTYGILALAGSTPLLLPGILGIPSACADPEAAPPTTVHLPGVVRDLHRTDTNFNVAPSAGNGHYAGNIGLTLPSSGVPDFVGGGFKVAAEWKDKNAHPISPCAYLGTGAGMALATAPTIDANAYFDAWDSFKGPYGGTNVGPAPALTTGAPMPTINAPNLGASAGNKLYSGTNTINTTFRCNSFTTVQSAVLNISGNVTIVVDGNFTLAKLTTVNIMPNSSLLLYVKGAISINQGSIVNMNTFKPVLCTIYNLGTSTIEINQDNKVCATIVSPKAGMHLSQNDNVYGTFLGTTMKLDQTTGFHWDGIQHKDSCGLMIKDTAGTPGATSTGGIPSVLAFKTWFTDTMGSNLSMNYSLDLTLNSSTGVYEYLSDAFHPIDNILFGNEAQAHNYYFTFSVEAPFKYVGCGGRFFEFQGADDAWLFINNKLVMDLGGIIPGTSQYVEMDRLGLVDGQTYKLKFFYAQRQTAVSGFRMRTNVDFVQDTKLATVTASCD